jgi:hypothetical protein
LVPIYDDIRQHKAAIDLVREMAQGKKAEINLEVIKRIYLMLAPEEAEGKGPPKYRKDMPLHRLYFHDIAQTDKIAYRMRQLVQSIDSTDSKRLAHPVRFAAKAQHQFLHIYPFPKHSGKVARMPAAASCGASGSQERRVASHMCRRSTAGPGCAAG